VLGDPRVAVTWLVNELRTFADGIQKTHIVTTGTCVIPFVIAPGDALRMDFGDFGSVEAQIS
jgi:2-keto-4-pentenoate hydratase